jgi:hypothetical protein
MLIQYLEIVSPAVEDTCAALEAAHRVTFSEPQAALGMLAREQGPLQGHCLRHLLRRPRRKQLLCMLCYVSNFGVFKAVSQDKLASLQGKLEID